MAVMAERAAANGAQAQPGLGPERAGSGLAGPWRRAVADGGGATWQATIGSGQRGWTCLARVDTSGGGRKEEARVSP